MVCVSCPWGRYPSRRGLVTKLPSGGIARHLAYPMQSHQHGIAELPEYQLELLLGYDSRRHILESGYFENPTQADHWHRTIDDPGRPYAYVSVEQLLVDFFGEVERTLRDLDVQYVIVEGKLR